MQLPSNVSLQLATIARRHDLRLEDMAVIKLSLVHILTEIVRYRKFCVITYNLTTSQKAKTGLTPSIVQSRLSMSKV